MISVRQKSGIAMLKLFDARFLKSTFNGSWNGKKYGTLGLWQDAYVAHVIHVLNIHLYININKNMNKKLYINIKILLEHV